MFSFFFCRSRKEDVIVPIREVWEIPSHPFIDFDACVNPSAEPTNDEDDDFSELDREFLALQL